MHDTYSEHVAHWLRTFYDSEPHIFVLKDVNHKALEERCVEQESMCRVGTHN